MVTLANTRASATPEVGSASSIGRGRFRLREAALWVAVAAVASAVLRSPHLRDSDNLFDPWALLGLVLAPVAMVLLVVLGRRIARAVIDPRARNFAELGWRVTGVLVLAAYLAGQGASLSRPPYLTTEEAIWGRNLLMASVNPRLIAMFGLLGLLGLGLGLAPAAARRPDRRRPSLAGSALAAILVSLAGVAYLAVYGGVIARLVLIAIEGVWMAQSPPRFPTRPFLDARIETAAPAVLAAGLTCLVPLTWLLRSLRDSGWRSNRVGRSILMFRALSVALAAGSAGWLMRATLPSLSPETAEGLGMLLGPRAYLEVLGGLTLLAAGLAARGTVFGPLRDRPTRPWRIRLGVALGWTLAVAVCLWVIGLASLYLARWAFPESSVLDQVWEVARSPHFTMLGSLGTNAPPTLADAIALILNPEHWPLVAGLTWVAALLIRAAVANEPDRLALFDAILRDRASTSRFFGLWAAWVVLLPSSTVALLLSVLVVDAYVTPFRT